MKCKYLNDQVAIDASKEFEGIYKTNNPTWNESYSYYRSAEETDKYNTHFTVYPTRKGNGEFSKFHISLNFSSSGIINGSVYYDKEVCKGTNAERLPSKERRAFEAFLQEHQEDLDQIARQFWLKVQEDTETHNRLQVELQELNRRNHIQQIKKRHEDELLSRPGVTAVDIDYKISKGIPSGELAIIVFVEKKLEVAPSEAIPKSIEGIKTDVWEGVFYPHSAPLVSVDKKSEFREVVGTNPMEGGLSVGPCNKDMYGTLGLILETSFGADMIISSAHVLASSPHTKQGDTLSEPAFTFGGHCPEDLAGEYFMGFMGQPSNIDAALAVVSPTRAVLPKTIFSLGPTTGHDVTFPGDDVAKFGARTQFTSGKVASDTFTCRIDYHNFGSHIYYNQLRIQSINPNFYFSQPGDSGSIVVNEEMQAVGMIMGGGKSGNGHFHTIANPIDDINRVFEENGIRFV